MASAVPRGSSPLRQLDAESAPAVSALFAAWASKGGSAVGTATSATLAVVSALFVVDASALSAGSATSARCSSVIALALLGTGVFGTGPFAPAALAATLLGAALFAVSEFWSRPMLRSAPVAGAGEASGKAVVGRPALALTAWVT